MALRAVDLSGRQRVLLPAVGRSLTLLDVAFDERLLLERSSGRLSIAWRPNGEAREREVGWLDGSEVRDISDDGRAILFAETRDGGEAGGQGVYLRRSDGSPAVRLGNGIPLELSRDGKWALAMVGRPPEIVAVPTGPGSVKKISTGGITPFTAGFAPDGDHIMVVEVGKPEQFRIFLVGLEGGPPHSVPVPGMAFAGIAMFGGRFAYVTTEGQVVTVSTVDGTRGELPGPRLNSSEGILDWSGDGRFLYIASRDRVPVRVLRRNVETGATSPFLEIGPADAAGVTDVLHIALTPDGTSYAYTYYRTEASDLFVAEGLK